MINTTYLNTVRSILKDPSQKKIRCVGFLIVASSARGVKYASIGGLHPPQRSGEGERGSTRPPLKMIEER
jgi:hypothetical protein